MDRETPTRTQPYTKQLTKAGTGRGGFPRKSIPTGTQYQMTSPASIHACNTTQTEQVLLRNTYVYACNNNQWTKETMNVKESKEGASRRVWRGAGKGEMIELQSQK